jgi:hypothetical protein
MKKSTIRGTGFKFQELTPYLLLPLLCFLYFFSSVSGPKADEIPDERLTGVVYFSGGADLAKCNFITNEKQTLFKFMEESRLGNEITNTEYPVYLKSKNKMLFKGYGYGAGAQWLFESNLNLQHWKKYERTRSLRTFALSPDEQWIVYSQFKSPGQLLIKRYEDLEKQGHERAISEPFLAHWSPPIWISNHELVYNTARDEVLKEGSEIVYQTTEDRVIKFDLRNGSREVLTTDVDARGISPDKKFILCANLDEIYLYDLERAELKKVVSNIGSQASYLWSPDGQYFLFSRIRDVKFTWNFVAFFSEVLGQDYDIYAYHLPTGTERKVPELHDHPKPRLGGFWLKEDPAEREIQDQDLSKDDQNET